MTARHIPTLQLPQIRFNKGEAITQYRRLALLRRYLTDDRVPLRIRVIACLMLLYAQPLSRILRLITSDITHDEYGQTWICFGHPPAPSRPAGTHPARPVSGYAALGVGYG